MVDTLDAQEPQPAERTYLSVFGALVVLTAISFWTISAYWPLTHEAGHSVVLVVAVCKALLVALFFMHLKHDWFKVYVLVVPALILGTILICALLPDLTFAHGIKYLWLGLRSQ